MDPRPLSTAEFDEFAEPLDYPMFVVTATDGTEPSGCLVGFTTQTSIDPPRFLVCLSEKNHTFRVARDADLLAVHRLGDDQHGLAEVFGGETGDQTDKFARVRWRRGPAGVPVLEDCPAYVVGRVLARQPMGDHTGFLLEPVAVAAEDGDDHESDPLTLDDVTDVDPGHPA
ncbi:flavin reductase (DIM6/NTAB) family NADH-FMN oxidoreductase RutF [Marmoricola sp. URHA0025 HA25]